MDEEALQIEALLLSRWHLYGLFHKLFGGNPTSELIEAVRSEATVDAVDEFSRHNEKVRGILCLNESESLQSEGDGAGNSLLSRLQDEYARLFVGFGDSMVQPIESPYVTSTPVLFSENTLILRRIYQAHGFAAARYPHVADDHIALMCDFMSRVSEELLVAFRSGDLQRVKEASTEQAAFVATHLTNWLPVFIKKQNRVSEIELYPKISESLLEFAMVDQLFLSEVAAWTVECMDGVDDEGLSAHQVFSHEVPDSFVRLEDEIAKVRGLRLVGLEDCELAAANE